MTMVTLAAFASLVGAPSKWILNARALLRDEAPYSTRLAEHYLVIWTLNAEFGVPLARADEMARRALLHGELTRVSSSSGLVTLEIDVERVRAAVATRASTVANTYAPRRPGRRPRRAARPLKAAEEYGIDTGLLKANLERSPEQRLRHLDAMKAFRSRARRRADR